ncbi:MAG TPA: undecaprenyldiphospho-muramoylpentapeptide beta-N-acetylglucosaminyltransferase [Pseudolabrys sp.]|nr:undecaprenyldiphospho-muramoylpentapeptide beta-N-acetylglucosaminyltransferase [Pseudolabrys sp.]
MGGISKIVLLAAGGTGGHLFPAEALAVALEKRGIIVDLATDTRAAHFRFPARQVHLIPSATLRGRNPIAYARTLTVLGAGTMKALLMLGRVKPAVVVGFGGYPTIPPVLAASLRGIPTVLHEQNGVMGRANRLLAARVTAIATGFRDVSGVSAALKTKMTLTGNPIRSAVIAAASTPYTAPAPDGVFRLAVFGGSQGARVMSDIVPQTIERLPSALRERLFVTQQARGEDLARVQAIYSRLGVAAEIAAFFPDLPARIADSHLIVSRSGASTVAELSAIGRPAILVPLPHALDQDQLANARVLEKAGGAICIEQANFSPERLATEIMGLVSDPQRLARMAAAARSAGTIDAADRLAAVVMQVGAIG